MKARSTALLSLALAGLLAAAGCGREVHSPQRDFQRMKRAFDRGRECEADRSYKDALKRYAEARRIAESDILPRLVPGSKLLPEVEKLRNESAAAAARVKEAMRKEKAGLAESAAARAAGAPLKNLPPPVLAYRPPAAKPPDGQEDPKDPKDPEKDPVKPKEPEKPKGVRVTKVVLKKDGSTILIYWTFTNLSENTILFGAPIGELLNTTRGSLTKFRQHFLQEGFVFNPEDPLASKGTAATPEGFKVGGREVRTLVTVGTTTQGKYAGGARVVIRMSGSDEELKDTFMGITRE